MRIAAVSTFPPGDRPVNGFASVAVGTFADTPDLEEIVVIADIIGIPETPAPKDSRITVDRCWTYDSVGALFRILAAVVRHKPDVVWLNCLYSAYGTRPITMFLPILLPICLRALRIPCVVLLHSFVQGIDVEKMGIRVPLLARWAERFAFASFACAERVVTMDHTHFETLARLMPPRKIQWVEQDLFPAHEFFEPPAKDFQLLAIGYFGTYKKLEIPLQAFGMLRHTNKAATFVIAGRDNFLAPGYLNALRRRHPTLMKGVHFLGYVSEEHLPKVFCDSNVVVLHHTTTGGSSGALRLAAAHGRAIVVPRIEEFSHLERDGWGVVYYEPGSVNSLCSVLQDLSNDYERQVALGALNHRRARQSAANSTFAAFHSSLLWQLASSRRPA